MGSEVLSLPPGNWTRGLIPRFDENTHTASYDYVQLISRQGIRHKPEEDLHTTTEINGRSTQDDCDCGRIFALT